MLNETKKVNGMKPGGCRVLKYEQILRPKQVWREIIHTKRTPWAPIHHTSSKQPLEAGIVLWFQHLVGMIDHFHPNCTLVSFFNPSLTTPVALVARTATENIVNIVCPKEEGIIASKLQEDSIFDFHSGVISKQGPPGPARAGLGPCPRAPPGRPAQV